MHSYLWQCRYCTQNNLPRNKKDSIIFITNVFTINSSEKHFQHHFGNRQINEISLVSLDRIYTPATAWCAMSSCQKWAEKMTSFSGAFSATLMDLPETRPTFFYSILDVNRGGGGGWRRSRADLNANAHFIRLRGGSPEPVSPFRRNEPRCSMSITPTVSVGS